MEINIQNVNMTYPNGKIALKDLNLDLKAPSLIGLLGPNGAGKSTLMKLLVAALMPTGGSILVDGQPLAKTDRLLKARLGYLPQDFGLFDELTVTQFLDYMAALKGISNSKAAIQKTIQAVNLEEKAKSKIRTLSGGQRQRVGIAQALLGNPPFLIFDEPTVGLDPEERIHFRNLFSRTAEDRLVLLSTHIIEDVQSVCDQIVVINHGNILFTGTPEQLIQSAAGHVGVFWEKDEVQEKGLHITARVNTSQGIRCRAVADKLPRLRPRHGKAQSVNHIVQSALENAQEVFARDAGLLDSHFIVFLKLALEQAVKASGLLLLSELHAVFRQLAPALAVLAGRVVPARHRAFFGKAAVALQEELLLFAPAQLANGVRISSHSSCTSVIILFFSSADGSRCAGWASRP